MNVWAQIDALLASFSRELKATSAAVRELKGGGSAGRRVRPLALLLPEKLGRSEDGAAHRTIRRGAGQAARGAGRRTSTEAKEGAVS